MTNWRNRLGEERLQALLQESLAVATKTGAMKPGDLARVIVDTTVQPKNITFPTDAKLLNRAREKLVRLAKKLGVELTHPGTRTARAEDLQPACARGGVHRQRQGTQALRVRRQGQRRHHPQAQQGRPVRRPRASAARQSL